MFNLKIATMQELIMITELGEKLGYNIQGLTMDDAVRLKAAVLKAYKDFWPTEVSS